MAISGVDPKCYILALFVRDDGTRFLLGDDPYEFKDKQLHFQPNTIANDVVEVQGNDGYLLAGQVRRPGTQSFDGYVGNGTNSKAEVEAKRRDFLQFFRRSHFYKVIYVFPNGTAIQRKQGFLVDDPTVQELYQQYPEYHVALNFEDVNYYTYEEDDEGHEIYAKEAIIKLAGGGATGGLIWDNNGVVWENPWSDIVTVSGVDFHVDNLLPVRVPIEGTQLKGDTFQQTYTGKNLIDPTNLTYVYANSPTQIELSTIDGGIRMVNNGGASQDRFAVFKSVDLTLYVGKVVRMKATFGTGGGIRLYRIASDGSGRTQQATTTTSDNEISFTVPADLGTSNYLGYVLDVPIGGGTIVDFTNLIMTIDESLEPFEPYTGGILAPNPDYPQDVQTVTGMQSVWVHGKNLLGMQNVAEFTQNGVKISVQDGVLSLDGTATASTGVVITNLIDNIVFQEDKSYTFSKVTISGTASGSWALQIRDSDSNTLLETTPNSYPKTYSGVSGVGAAVRLYYANGRSFNNYKIKIQAEEGYTATTYEPYQGATYTIDLGATELCKIGDYQDYIYKSGDDWYVHKDLSSLVFDGSEDWSYASGSAIPFRYAIADAGQLAQAQTTPPDVFSNYYTPFAWNNYSSVSYGATASTNASSLNIICFRNINIATLADWKTWLSTHNTIVYYPLATPTDTKITDATLVGQLEALDAMRLFIGENNILVSASSPNLPATLQFDYFTQYLEPHGAEWEEGGTKGATIVNVDAIDNTYPVWELTGPAINPTLSVLTTNTTLTYNGTITASQKLVIDMFNKTATLNGTSVIGNVTGDFVYMAPGTNRVAYTAGNADAPDSKISWQEVVG